MLMTRDEISSHLLFGARNPEIATNIIHDKNISRYKSESFASHSLLSDYYIQPNPLLMSLTSTTAAVRGVFALQVVVTVLAFLPTLILSSMAAILFIRRSSRHRSRKTSPRGTFAFLIPGILCLAIAQAATAARVAQQTKSSSPASITHAFSLYYPGSSSSDTNSAASSTSVNLSFLNAFAFIISTICLNGAVWLHSSHATSNGLAVGQPSRISIVGNVLLLLLMAATGFASWGLAMSSYTANAPYGNVLQNNLSSRSTYTAFRACVVAASISVATEAIRRFKQVKNHSSRDVSPSLPLLLFTLTILR